MLREVVPQPILRKVFHQDTKREDLREWNVQMYYEAMGMDFGHDDNEEEQ